MDLFDGFSRGVMEANAERRTLEQQAMPQAAFMREAAIARSRQFAFDPSKIFLGVIGGEAKAETRTGRSVVRGGRPVGFGDDTHFLTVAGSRAGKGRSVIVPTLLSYAGSVFANDPKGELANVTTRARLEQGHHVFSPDPFSITQGEAAKHRARYNPMTILKPDSPTMIEDAGLITDAIVVENASQHDPHWDESATGLIQGVVLFVATDQLFEGRRTLPVVRDLVAGQANNAGETGMDVLEAQMRANNAADPIVRQMIIDSAEDFFSKPDDERGSVLSNARRHLRFLGLPQIRESLSGHDFDLSELKTGRDGRPVTIFLCLPAMRMSTCNRWLRLFLNLALAAMEATPAKPEPPVLFALDEFPVLGRMKSLEDAAGQIAGFGARLWPVIQDLGQLKALYRDRWQTFMGNAGAVQFFGLNDLETLEWVSKRLGQTSLIVRNKSEVSDQDATRSGRVGATWSVQTQPLLTIDEAARLFGRHDPQARQLVLFSSFDPVVLQRVNYDSHELFEGRFDAPSF
jgi:type IV secretion system protein VirD4